MNKNSNQFITMTVGIIVAVIVASVVLIPIVNGMTEPTKTYYNGGMPYASPDTEDHTILVTDDSITVDGDPVDTSLFPGNFANYTLVFSESGEFVRLDYSANEIRVVLSAVLPTQYPLNSDETVTIAISGSTATISSSDTTKPTKTISDVLYYISTEGDYVLALNPHVSDESVLYGAGQTNFNVTQGTVASYTFTYAAWSGTLDDLSGTVIYVSTISGAEITYTTANSSISSVVATTTQADGSDLLRVDSVAVNYALVGSDSETYTPTATYTYFLAPAEVVYDNPNYVGGMTATILAVIPIFIILAILMGVVGMFLYRKESF